ncbi:SEC-C metal-binding domain-containing protein [Paraburkholderia strydomiana]|uniref:SEC-C metal-binding domain-containing protein n=1 Tax=Paraburkholderia strydomiana TaxID=1245417 RepID=UPI0038B8819F
MLTPIHKEEGSTPGEKALAKLAGASFFGLWSYASVHRFLQKGTRAFAHEVADLLVLFGRDVIIFSEKDIQFPVTNDIKVTWPRWFRKSVVASVDQLRGAETYIRSGRGPLFLDAKCTQPFPFPLNAPDLRVHLVAICRNSSGPGQRYFAQFEEKGVEFSSTETLAFNAPFREQDMLANPFWIGDFDPSKTFVHVFDEESLHLLMTELDTGPDFIDYLLVRERAIRSEQLTRFFGEEDFLAAYLTNEGEEGFGSFLEGTPTTVVEARKTFAIAEHMWREFSGSLDYALHRTTRLQAGTWKRLTDEFSQAVVTAVVGEAQDQSLDIHERAVRALAAENRVSRAMLGRLLTEIHSIAHSKAVTVRTTHSLSNPKRLYIFLLYPQLETHESYSEYRKERMAWMQMYARCAQVKFTEYSEIAVLGVDTKESVGGSETIMVVDAYPDMPQDLKAQTLALMKEKGIFTGKNAPVRPTPSFVQSRPASTVQTHWSKSPGANEPCICGSGKKYKKCCRL